MSRKRRGGRAEKAHESCWATHLFHLVRCNDYVYTDTERNGSHLITPAVEVNDASVSRV